MTIITQKRVVTAAAFEEAGVKGELGSAAAEPGMSESRDAQRMARERTRERMRRRLTMRSSDPIIDYPVGRSTFGRRATRRQETSWLDTNHKYSIGTLT